MEWVQDQASDKSECQGFGKNRPFFKFLPFSPIRAQFLKNPPIGDVLRFSFPGCHFEAKTQTVILSGFPANLDPYFGLQNNFSEKWLHFFLVLGPFLKNPPIGDHLQFEFGGSHLIRLGLSFP